MPRNPEIRSVIADEKGHVAIDLVCPSCRYNLRGLLHDGACPECGLAVARAILAANDPRWTKLQIVLSILAITIGIVFPIANFTSFQYSLGVSNTWHPEGILEWFMRLWLLGGLTWLMALVNTAFTRRFNRTCLLIIVAALAESVIAVVINALTWLGFI